jgi:hypothetical protein
MGAVVELVLHLVSSRNAKMRLNAFARHDKTQGSGSPDSDDSSRGGAIAGVPLLHDGC